METITVTIGRNVKDESLDDWHWNSMVKEAREILRANVTELWIDADYAKLWAGRDEDAWVFYGPLAEDFTSLDHSDLTYRLRDLCFNYSGAPVKLTSGLDEVVDHYETVSA